MLRKKCLNNRKVKMVENMKKTWKIVMIIIAILVSLLGIIYMIDISRMKQNKPVLFSNGGRKYNEPTKEENFPSFYGTVIESKQGNIIVEPREGESIRKSADKISISLGKNSDVIYSLGTNVKITYTGDIRETYPAQVTAINIELKSAENNE